MKGSRKIGPLLAGALPTPAWHSPHSSRPLAAPEFAPEARAGIRRYQPVAFAAMLFCLGVIVRSDTQLLALAAIVVFLTYPVYPFVIQHAQRPPAPQNY